MNTAAADSDRLTRFLLPQADVRGVRVHLRDTWNTIRSHDEHLPGANALLGQAVAASALFTAHAKIDGRLSVQLSGLQQIRTLFAECTSAGTLRGILRLQDPQQPLPDDLREVTSGATLAITIEGPGIGSREPTRYQGLVELSQPTLSAAFESYFLQSEQLPTRILLAADDQGAAGVMLQQLPGSDGDADGFTRASALLETLSPAELLAWDNDTLLHRLFHQEAPELMGERPLRFGCSCSRERVSAMLQSLGETEAQAAVIDGHASVRCEFCARTYLFEPADIDALFTGRQASMDGPERLQ